LSWRRKGRLRGGERKRASFEEGGFEWRIVRREEREWISGLGVGMEGLGDWRRVEEGIWGRGVVTAEG
jgi:hypothetical protein